MAIAAASSEILIPLVDIAGFPNSSAGEVATKMAAGIKLRHRFTGGRERVEKRRGGEKGKNRGGEGE